MQNMSEVTVIEINACFFQGFQYYQGHLLLTKGTNTKEESASHQKADYSSCNLKSF